MLDTKDVENEVLDRVSKILQNDPTSAKLISNIKSIIMKTIKSKGISVNDSMDVAAELIVLAKLVQ